MLCNVWFGNCLSARAQGNGCFHPPSAHPIPSEALSHPDATFTTPCTPAPLGGSPAMTANPSLGATATVSAAPTTVADSDLTNAVSSSRKHHGKQQPRVVKILQRPRDFFAEQHGSRVSLATSREPALASGELQQTRSALHCMSLYACCLLAQ